MATEVAAKTAYEILGVPKNAGIPAIRKVFRKLMLKHHPDAVPAEEKVTAAEYCARINQAYELLCDAKKRKNYDALLARGIVPDLAAEVGALPLPALGAIIGEIQALNLKVNQKRILKRISKELRKQLTESLIASVEVNETVVDSVRIDEMPISTGFHRPPGVIEEGWLVVTELRLMVLLRFVHRWSEGNTNYTQTNWRAYSYWYSSMTNMVVHEIGRAFPSYELDLVDDYGTRLVLGLRSPRLTRLFLVANTYRLPLKIQTAPADATARRNEICTTAGQILILPFAWAIPFVAYSIYNPLDYVCGKDPNRQFAPFAQYRAIFDFLTSCGLTTLVLYVTTFLAIYLGTRLYLAWNTGWTHEVLGELKVDYAVGSAGLAADVVGEEQPPQVPHVKQSEKAEPATTSVPEAAVEVELPAAIREARNRPAS